MSGGVDSSVAASLMLDAGYTCIGVTMKLYETGDSGQRIHKGCCSLADVNDARQAAYALNMPHYVLNFTETFKSEVIRRFIETYEKGGTPNPCIDCNRYVKFNRLLFRARELDFDLLATGHYARIEKDAATSRYLLKKSVHEKKDQSYVLYSLTQDELAHSFFPLGSLSKDRVREIAKERGFINAKKQDSQDICFVPDRDYAGFMERFTGKQYPQGDIISLEGKVLGRHRGIVRYTIGQRRGLGVAANEPVYVIRKDITANTITLGPERALYSKILWANNINLIALDSIDKPLRVTVKTRYQEAEKKATVEQTGPDEFRVEFDDPLGKGGQRAVSPGQAAVLYDGDIVLGGGTIIK
jgi:tRNA-specific 2-thiouridylase